MYICTHVFDILSDLYSQIASDTMTLVLTPYDLYVTYLSDILSDRYSDTLSETYHKFLKCIRPIIWHIVWQILGHVLTFYPASILMFNLAFSHSFWHIHVFWHAELPLLWLSVWNIFWRKVWYSMADINIFYTYILIFWYSENLSQVIPRQRRRGDIWRTSIGSWGNNLK